MARTAIPKPDENTMKYLPIRTLPRKLKMIVFMPLLLSVLSACAIHYKNVPDAMPNPVHYAVSEKILYKINTLPVFSADGLDAVAAAFKASPVFRSAERYYEEEIPQKGIFVLVETEYKTPNLPAAAFGYLSVSTLTLLPAWSNHDGFNLFYRIYVDGVLVKTIPYESRRFVAIWILLLPFAWVNWLTAGEYDAFYAITDGFIQDAQPYLAAVTNP